VCYERWEKVYEFYRKLQKALGAEYSPLTIPNIRVTYDYDKDNGFAYFRIAQNVYGIKEPLWMDRALLVEEILRIPEILVASEAKIIKQAMREAISERLAQDA